MDIESIRSFIELGQCSSITEASRRLHVSQPTLSKRIKSMESELDATLLERGSQHMRLTPAGSAFLNACVDIVNRYNRACDEVSRISKRPTVNIGGMLHDTYVKALLAILRDKCDAYTINCKDDPFDTLSDPLSSGDLDALFAPIGPSADVLSNPLVSFRLLKSERAYAAIGRKSDLSENAEVSLADLEGKPLVRIAQSHSTKDGWRTIEEACLHQGFFPAMQLLDPSPGPFDIGNGVYLLPESKISDLNSIVDSREVRIVPVVGDFSFDLYLITLKSPPNAAVEAFCNDIERYGQIEEKAAL